MVISPGLLAVATLIGRGLASLFPYSLRGVARFYLAPILGLSGLTVFASLAGRYVPLGDSRIVSLVLVAAIVICLLQERDLRAAVKQTVGVGAFGLACGASMLGPLLVFGGFNAHNDAFTYLAHADWLQSHAFMDIIAVDEVTPLTTQVRLYQQAGLRMGASFLLALVQALVSLEWSFDVYPAVIIATMAGGCLSIGFPLARILRVIGRPTRLALLALPAFTLGGIVFAANLGFLPQSLGLALGSGFLFAAGPALRWISSKNMNISLPATWLAIPLAMLLAASVFAYSELAPFLVFGLAGSGLVMAFRTGNLKRTGAWIALVGILSVLLLNTELGRAYAALRMQAGAVVGSPVDWSLVGYFAHALGTHGGAWDLLQWTRPDSERGVFWAGVAITGVLCGLLLSGRRSLVRITANGILMPAAVTLLALGIGLVYFRYFVPSPFSLGVGQSWSQFKLADWAHPFLMVFLILASASVLRRIGRWSSVIVTGTFVVTLFMAASFGILRTTPLMHHYPGVQDLNAFYHDFRTTVLNICSNATVYLSLFDQHHKFRQMAAYYLPDRRVASDWTGDGYITATLPSDRIQETVAPGDCVIEPDGSGGWLSAGTAVGPFRVGIYDGDGKIRVLSIAGAHGRETDGANWWHWVESTAIFELRPEAIVEGMTRTRISFEYGTRPRQTLVVRVSTSDGNSREFRLEGQKDGMARFVETVALPPERIAEMRIESDGQATPLSEQDQRMAAWLIRNLSVTPSP